MEKLGKEILSEDGLVYTVEPFAATPGRIKKLWETIQKHKIVVHDQARGSLKYFMDYLLSPTVVIYLVSVEDKEVGIFYADSIIPEITARGHYLFWDMKTAGRQQLVLTALRDFMDYFSLHRVEFSILIYAFAALFRVYKMNFTLEGKKFSAALREGTWHDTLEFAVIREDLTDEAVEAGKLMGNQQVAWRSFLDNDRRLAQYISRKER